MRRSLFAGLFVLLSLTVVGVLSADTSKDTPQGIPVLMYHQILSETPVTEDRDSVTLGQFREQMEWLHQEGYQTLSMDELADILNGKSALPERPILLTFDDGWKNALLAVPVLRDYGFKASFAIIPGAIGKKSYMDWEDVLRLDQDPLFEIGSHSMTHPGYEGKTMIQWLDGRVPGKTEKDVWFELKTSKDILEDKLGHSVDQFFWPGGWHDDRLITLADQAGYKMLLTAWDGLNIPGKGLSRIRRTVVSGKNDLNTFRQQLKNGLNDPTAQPTA